MDSLQSNMRYIYWWMCDGIAYKWCKWCKSGRHHWRLDRVSSSEHDATRGRLRVGQGAAALEPRWSNTDASLQGLVPTLGETRARRRQPECREAHVIVIVLIIIVVIVLDFVAFYAFIKGVFPDVELWWFWYDEMLLHHSVDGDSCIRKWFQIFCTVVPGNTEILKIIRNVESQSVFTVFFCQNAQNKLCIFISFKNLVTFSILSLSILDMLSEEWRTL